MLAFVLEKDFQIVQVIVRPETEEFVARAKLLKSRYCVHEGHTKEHSHALVELEHI